MNAFRSNIPDKTFEKLNHNGEFTRLAVNPGIINKHYTAAQFQKIAKVVGDTGAIKYSASYSMLLSIPTVDVARTIEELQDAGLYVVMPGPIVSMKACDFCDGDMMKAVPMT